MHIARSEEAARTLDVRKRARITLCAGAGLCALALGACSVNTTLPDLPKQTPAAWHSRDSAPPAAGLQPDLEHWWKAFDDGMLDRLIERALHENLNVQIVGQRLIAARALHHRSRSEFWPNLNFRVYEETAPGGNTGYLEMGFDASWEFGFFGRAKASARVNLADADNAAIDDAAARVLVVAEVARNYVELRAAQARARIFGDVVHTRQAQVELTGARLRARLGSQIESDRAVSELRKAQTDADESATAVVQGDQALAVLLGTFATIGDVVSTLAENSTQPTLPQVSVSESPADLLRTRPEIRRAEENVLKAAGELGIARSDLYPRLSIVGTLISSTALTGDLDKPNKAVPLIGPAFSIPLFDWGARRDIVSAREAALSAAVLAYREAILEGVAEVEGALAQFEARTHALRDAELTRAVSERAAQSARGLQRIGLGDGLDTANANLALAQSRLQSSNALRERALGYVALYKSLGGALPPARTDEAATGDAESAR
ncbi:MAG: efflux transporter outer membrane subunit [Rudaea sp.]